MTPEDEAEVREVLQQVIANINEQIIEITDKPLKQKLLELAKKHGWEPPEREERSRQPRRP